MKRGILSLLIAAALLLVGIWMPSIVTAVTLQISSMIARGVLGADLAWVDGGLSTWPARGCVENLQCFETWATAFREAVRTHAPALFGALFAAGALAAWGSTRLARAGFVRPSPGKARFAVYSELRKLAVRSNGAWFPLGYVLRFRWLRHAWQRTRKRPVPRILAGPQLLLPAGDLARHVLAIGLTGAHKTTAITYPVLLDAARHGVSVVALDLKYGEEDSLIRVAPEWQRQARDVLVFAPLEATTLRWNPLACCESIGDAQHLAAQLFDDNDSENPNLLYWIGAERHVCAVLCHALTTDDGPPTLERLRSLCEAGPAAVHQYVHTHPKATTLVARLGSYMAMLPKDEAGILQGIASRLEAWGDESVRSATGTCLPWERIDLARLRREPVLLIVGIPQSSLARLRWLCHLFLRDLASHLLRPRSPQEDVRVLLILEELPAWGPLPNLADYLATFRSRQVSVIAMLQSEAQGEYVYGRDGWAAVASNLVTKIYFSSLADSDAESLSRVMGTAMIEDVSISRSWALVRGQQVEHRRMIPTPLQRPEELRGIGASLDEVVVRLPGMPPARLWCPPFYLRPEYIARIPPQPPSTAELVVYHHLWARRLPKNEYPSEMHSPISAHTTDSRSSPEPDTLHFQMQDRCVDVPLFQGQKLRSGDVTEGLPTKERAELTRFLECLLLESRIGHARAVRTISRAGRIVEVRVDSATAIRICGGVAAMHQTARRWTALRWVRRIRPTFTLTRQALNAVDIGLANRLSTAFAPVSRTS